MGWLREVFRSRAGSKRGQAIVEMAFTFPLVFALIVTVLEVGFAFNAYITVVDAARNGARAGAVYLCDPSLSSADNDTNRENGGASPSYLDNVDATVSNTLAHGLRGGMSHDVTITYTPSSSTFNYDYREGDLINVLVVLHYKPLTGFFGNWTIDLQGQSSARIE